VQLVAERAAQFYIDGLAQAFPGRVLGPPIPFVNSVSELLAKSLTAPSTPVRHIGRKAFATNQDWFIDHGGAEDESDPQPVAADIAKQARTVEGPPA
jgi:hypothetical protein